MQNTNYRKFSFFLIVFGFSTSFFSCRKKDTTMPPQPQDPCAGIKIDAEISKTESVSMLNNGSITVLSPRGDSMSYNINNGAFQDLPVFNNLAPGSYTIVAKNKKGCSDTANVAILNYGAKYALVKQIITGYCGPCHLNGGTSGGRNYDTDANIIAAKDVIKKRTVDGTPSFMPQGGELTNVDKQKIVDWINAGGRISD
jgi:hypothetical protein